MIKAVTDDIKKKNGVLLSVFLFQYSLLIPLMKYVNSTLLIAGSGFVLLTIVLYINRNHKINNRVLVFFISVLLILVLKTILDNDSYDLIYTYIVIAGPPSLIFLYSYNLKSFLKAGYVLSIINFVLLCLYPFSGQYSYMRFGYGMLLTVIFLYVNLFYIPHHKKKLFIIMDFIILAVAGIETILYGARGCFFSLLLFLVLDLFIVHREHIIRNVLLIITAIIFYLNIINILDLLQTVTNTIGIHSYAITKYKLQLQESFEVASSGRIALYEDAIMKIKENPLAGNPINLNFEESAYVHNILLQTAQDFGIIALMLLIIFIIYTLIKMASRKPPIELKIALAILFSISIGRLMFSSVIWKRPEFWLLICFVINIRKLQDRNLTYKLTKKSK